MADDHLDAHDLWEGFEFTPDHLNAPLGVGADGQVVSVGLHEDDSAHVLIGGSTGTGKSVALRVVVLGLARHCAPDWLRILGIDLKGGELGWMEQLPHLERPVGTDDAGARAVFDYLGLALHRRQTLLQAAGVDRLVELNATSDTPVPWVVVLIDELLDVVWDNAELAAELHQVLAEGPQVGIHVVAATQRAEKVQDELVAAFSARVVGRTVSEADSLRMLDTDAATGIKGRGAALMRLDDGAAPRYVRRAFVAAEGLLPKPS